MKPLADQLECAQRELGLRQRTYPKWVAQGRITEAKAQHEIECMSSIVESIKKLKMLEEVSQEMQESQPFD